MRPIHLSAGGVSVVCASGVFYTAKRTTVSDRVTCKNCLRAMAELVEARLITRVVHFTSDPQRVSGLYPRLCGIAGTSLGGGNVTSVLPSVTCEHCLAKIRLYSTGAVRANP